MNVLVRIKLQYDARTVDDLDTLMGDVSDNIRRAAGNGIFTEPNTGVEIDHWEVAVYDEDAREQAMLTR